MTGISTIASSQYAKKASKYIEILNQLRRIGAHFAVNLPTIVFCGNQSAGKSSLLEAISGVRLPRSDGTCTRCVMELRLTESEEPWECQVSLRHEYDKDEKPLPRPTETKFGNKIDNPNCVELMARRAQKALLNPSNNSDQYFDWNFGEISYEEDSNSNSLKFTKNVVCLEIKGKGVPNLSLIDLPGIIRHTEKIEDRKFIQLIIDLVNSYIKKEESIIIATISCKDEIDNQEIVSLAKMVDPLGLRTLGVLTKPDTIEPGTHELWLKIMRGEAHKLSLGYYIVKNPNKMRLTENITFEEAREEETNFFEYEEPWKDYRHYLSERIGIKKLQTKLSDLLIKAIVNGLPVINKKIQENLDVTRAELVKIPKPLGKNSRMELFHMVKECATIINEEVECSNNSTTLWNSINNKFKEFKRDLGSSRSIFVVGKKASSTPYVKDDVKFDTLEEFVDNTKKAQNSTVKLKEVTETEITDQIDNVRGKLLPGFTPYSAVVKLIQDSQDKWKSPSHECLFKVYEIMASLVERVLDGTFSRFPTLRSQMTIYTIRWLDECKDETTKYIDFMYELERDNDPFTLNDSTIVSKKIEYLNKLNEAVRYDGREPTDTLEVIAYAMAYFNLAFKRYTDNIPMAIIHTFINGFTKKIEEKLMEEFTANDNCDLDELVKEEHSVSSRRDELQVKEKHMKEVLDNLLRFGIK